MLNEKVSTDFCIYILTIQLFNARRGVGFFSRRPVYDVVTGWSLVVKIMSRDVGFERNLRRYIGFVSLTISLYLSKNLEGPSGHPLNFVSVT